MRRLVRRGQAVPSQSPVVPHTTGYDPAFKSEMGDHDLPRAKALLDLYGYRDRDGDHFQTPKKPLVVSSSAIDVQGVLTNILSNVEIRGHWAAEFDGPKAIEHILVRHQRLKAPVYPVVEAK